MKKNREKPASLDKKIKLMNSVKFNPESVQKIIENLQIFIKKL